MRTTHTWLYYAMLCASVEQARRYTSSSCRRYGFGVRRGLWVIVGPMLPSHLPRFPISNTHTYCLCRTHAGDTPEQAAEEAAKVHTHELVGVAGFYPLVLRKTRSDRT